MDRGNSWQAQNKNEVDAKKGKIGRMLNLGRRQSHRPGEVCPRMNLSTSCLLLI